MPAVRKSRWLPATAQRQSVRKRSDGGRPATSRATRAAAYLDDHLAEGRLPSHYITAVHRILKEERDLVIQSRPLEATAFEVEKIRMAYVFYESGLSINVMYTIDDKKKRAVGFKLSDGMDVPAELATRFKFARQKSKLAGTIRGSYFVIKKEY